MSHHRKYIVVSSDDEMDCEIEEPIYQPSRKSFVVESDEEDTDHLWSICELGNENIRNLCRVFGVKIDDYTIRLYMLEDLDEMTEDELSYYLYLNSVDASEASKEQMWDQLIRIYCKKME